MSAALHADYYEALDRLKSGRPKIVPKGTRISKDAVSLEAGRKKGTIKKSRAIFVALIAAIDAAAMEQGLPQKTHAKVADKEKRKVKDLHRELDDALGREHSLLIELYEVRVKLNRVTGENVLPIRRRPTK